LQLDALRHPWSSTYAEFLKLVEERYGFKAHFTIATDPAGKKVKMPYLLSADKKRTIELPGNLKPEDQLTEFVVASLCSRIGVPPEDFGLKSEEPFDASFEFDLDD